LQLHTIYNKFMPKKVCKQIFNVCEVFNNSIADSVIFV